MSMVKTRGVPAAKKKSFVLPAREALFFWLPLWVGAQGAIEGQVALATSGDPDKVSPKKWAPRVGKTAFSEKASVSHRRTPYFFSLPI